MIYTRLIKDNRAALDYYGTNEDLNLEMCLTINTMFERKDLDTHDLCVMVLNIFKKLEEVDKLTLVDMLIKDVTGGSLWQELEDLSKSEKK